MKLMGVIGSIGSGKSTVCKRIIMENDNSLKPLSIVYFDLDKVSKILFNAKEQLRYELVDSFGLMMVESDFEKKREYVIEEIMDVNVKYNALNEILGKYIEEWLLLTINEYTEKGFDLLLIEGVIIPQNQKILKLFDSIIHVTATRDICYDRGMKRNKYTTKQFDILYRRSIPSDGYNKTHNKMVYFIPTEPAFEGRFFGYIEDVLKDVFKDMNNSVVAIDTDKSKKRKIALYAGSFSPLHIGHYAMIEDLLDIFDGVVLLQCINGGKHDSGKYKIDDSKLPKQCQLIEWDYAFIDFLDIEYANDDLVIVRGIRNGDDLEYENNYIKHLSEQCRYNGKDMLPVVYMPCREEYRHISSSSIRAIMPFDESYAKSLIV